MLLLLLLFLYFALFFAVVFPNISCNARATELRPFLNNNFFFFSLSSSSSSFRVFCLRHSLSLYFIALYFFFGSVPCTMSSGLPFHFTLLRYRNALLYIEYVFRFGVFVKTQTQAFFLSSNLFLSLFHSFLYAWKIFSDFLLNVRRFRCVALLFAWILLSMLLT